MDEVQVKISGLLTVDRASEPAFIEGLDLLFDTFAKVRSGHVYKVTISEPESVEQLDLFHKCLTESVP